MQDDTKQIAVVVPALTALTQTRLALGIQVAVVQLLHTARVGGSGQDSRSQVGVVEKAVQDLAGS
jgi:hypothetical protein